MILLSSYSSTLPRSLLKIRNAKSLPVYLTKQTTFQNQSFVPFITYYNSYNYNNNPIDAKRGIMTISGYSNHYHHRRRRNPLRITMAVTLMKYCSPLSCPLSYHGVSSCDHFQTYSRLQMSTTDSTNHPTNIHDVKNKSNVNKDYLSSYATEYHAPVMARECIEAMLHWDRNDPNDQVKKPKNKYKTSNQQKYNANIPNDSQLNQHPEEKKQERKPLILVDGTLGGGGHSSALLEQMKPGDILIGCDVDPDALSTASERLKSYLISDPPSTTAPSHPIFIPVQSNFRNLHKVIHKLEHPYLPNTALIQNEGITNDDNYNTNRHSNRGVDAILLDLGVSSYQIDNPTRGFAIQGDGPLDMRMSSTTSLTAADICNELDEVELTRILKRYGDEPRAKAIARSIIQNRPLLTTFDLTNAVSEVTPEFVRKGRRMGRMATLARVFQAFRIMVNEEDSALQEALEVMASQLITKMGGRLVVLSYHSMEDRMVKRVMRDGTVDKTQNYSHHERDMYGNYIGRGKPWKMLGKGRKATEEEIKVNPRARSATLRVAERLYQNNDS